MTSAAAQRPTTRRRAAIWITIGVIVALVILFFIFSGLYTDWLWYQQLGFLEVLTTQWFAAAALFGIGFISLAFPMWLSIQLAYRLRPVYAKLNAQLDRYQQVIEPLRRLAMYGIPIIFGLFAGVSAGSRWQSALMWLNRTPTGKVDPQFHLDISFYLFDLPFYRGLVGFASATVIISLIAVLATTYLYGSIRITGREVRIAKAARVQIAITAAVYLLLQGVSVWLDRYATLTDANVNGGMINGAAYTDTHATIPGRAILAGIAVVVAVLFIITALVGRWRLPLIGTALLLVSAIIIGSIYPWVVQKFQVDPSEKTIEQTYVKRAIDGTRDAYGVSDVQERLYNAKTTAEQGALRQDAETTANIRIIDPAEVSQSFAQLQQFKQYYGFPDTLDVDRYKLNGKEQDTVIAVRELEQSGISSRNWFNDALVYTHGYGVVAAYGNKRSPDGQPVFLESGIPVSGELGKYQPRVYFGEKSPRYSIVGGLKNKKGGVELDYPAGKDGASQTYTTFQGNGGPKLDNLFNRLVYALKFQDEQIVLSNSVNSHSQILYDRSPVERVQKVAPYLTIDSDPYPAVVDGRIKWIIDGYTTSDSYPYSKVNSFSSAIADSQTPKTNPYAMDDINYIRNSVKATVDAYDGSVTLYAWDTSDPILKTWEKIFPTTVKPMKEMSSQLLSHVRYPADLFKVQRDVLGQFHVTDPGSFFSRDDAWVTPDDPVSSNQSLQPPYYLTMQMPGQKKPSFSLYSTYIPQATTSSTRSVLKGYLAVDADAGGTPGKIASGYGKLRLLTLPTDDNVPGPGQVQNTFGSDPNVSQALNVLRLGKTDVISGNLLTLPVGGGLLYVQPVYVKSTGETSYPLLQKVLVAFGEKIAFEDTLDGALDALFGGDSGANAGDTNVDTGNGQGGTGGTETPPADNGTGTGNGSQGGSTGSAANNAALQQALQDAKAAMLARDQALKAGDWAAYGTADQQLTDALNRALAAEGDSTTGSGSTGGSGSGSTGSSGSGSSGK
ncbi:UPF0182 family protein [Microbacterium sp. STN6]|uniref:UPF0182 family membrane protein n=1 Tax=Microbacterium sp. STN6 TaxID=2995588 RepID=UPI002260862E|nr:UPF0182 family protein [Microbacterium sp. STN6]MCX7521952.1 UPF0182 family protein [Microbacterium sp. STN6]